MRLKYLYESHIVEIGPDVERQIEELAPEVFAFKDYKPAPSRVRTPVGAGHDSYEPQEIEPVDEIPSKLLNTMIYAGDMQVNVNIVNDPNKASGTNGAIMGPDGPTGERYITVNVAHMDSLEEVVSTMTHEMIHVLDPDEDDHERTYEMGWNDDGDGDFARYHKDPHEFNAFSGELIIRARQKLRGEFAKNPYSARSAVNVIMNLLRKGDVDGLVKALSLNPEYYSPIQSWRQRPTLWRRFSMRLWNALQEMLDDLEKNPQGERKIRKQMVQDLGMDT